MTPFSGDVGNEELTETETDSLVTLLGELSDMSLALIHEISQRCYTKYRN